MSDAVRVFVVDDHPAVREGVALVLGQEGLAVSGQAGDTASALAGMAASPSDVALVDLALGDDNGLDLIRNLRAQAPQVPVVVYSMHEDSVHVEDAFAAGAQGYVTKREPPAALVEAIKEVLAGRLHASPRAARSMAGRAAGPAGAHPDLSTQEREVYRLLGDGCTAGEIAQKLGISVRTVESYCVRIQSKLELDGMRSLRRHAIAHRRP